MNEDNISTSIGAEEQDPAAPADVDNDIGEGTTPADNNDENSRYAAARRKAEAERDRIISEERAKFEAEKAQLEADIIGSLGYTDPATGTLINSRDSLAKFRASQAEAEVKAFAQRSGISEEELSSIIDRHPAVVQAKAAQKQAEIAASKARLTEQLKEITRLDPDVKTVDDLLKSEKYNEVKDLVKQGYSLANAYKVVNLDRIISRSADTSKQTALNAINSKSHLIATSVDASGGNSVVIPDETMKMYKQFNPGWTDKQIAEHYARYKKK